MTRKVVSPMLALVFCLSAGCEDKKELANVDPPAPMAAAPAAPAPVAPARASDCVETDFEIVQPFIGPAFVGMTGTLAAPLPAPYIVATTAGWNNGNPDDAKLLQDKFALVMGDIFTRSGLLGASLAQSKTCASGRTLSIWRDMASMLEFVAGAAHADAVTIINQTTKGWETTHWTGLEPNQVPTFEEANRRLEEARRQ